MCALCNYLIDYRRSRRIGTGRGGVSTSRRGGAASGGRGVARGRGIRDTLIIRLDQRRGGVCLAEGDRGGWGRTRDGLIVWLLNHLRGVLLLLV